MVSLCVDGESRNKHRGVPRAAGCCNTNGSVCTLRALIWEVTSTSWLSDVLVLAAGLKHTLRLSDMTPTYPMGLLLGFLVSF